MGKDRGTVRKVKAHQDRMARKTAVRDLKLNGVPPLPDTKEKLGGYLGCLIINGSLGLMEVSGDVDTLRAVLTSAAANAQIEGKVPSDAQFHFSYTVIAAVDITKEVADAVVTITKIRETIDKVGTEVDSAGKPVAVRSAEEPSPSVVPDFSGDVTSLFGEDTPASTDQTGKQDNIN